MGIRIITVSRQFGSGGRELGKRLSDLLGWDYYDREIIQALADEQWLDPDYVRRVVNGHGWSHYQLTYRNSFRQAGAVRGIIRKCLCTSGKSCGRSRRWGTTVSSLGGTPM